jgi:AcrR family transcriptional regulator
MNTPIRLLRAHVEKMGLLPALTEKQRARERTILATAQPLLVADRCSTLTITKLAAALHMSPDTVRWHFTDIESVLAEIMLRHLKVVADVIGKIPADEPGGQAARRAAYIEATRARWGGLTEPHLLLTRKRHTLPEDLAKPVAELRALIGEMLAGKYANLALDLLDAPHMQATDIETMLAVAVKLDAPPANQAEPQPHATAPPKQNPLYRNPKGHTLH